jgi:hypothetical protein
VDLEQHNHVLEAGDTLNTGNYFVQTAQAMMSAHQNASPVCKLKGRVCKDFSQKVLSSTKPFFHAAARTCQDIDRSAVCASSKKKSDGLMIEPVRGISLALRQG